MDAGHKYCKSCSRSRSLFDFYRDKHAVDGMQARCKDCCKAGAKRNYRKNAKAIIAKATERYERVLPNLRKIGVTKDDYTILVATHKGVCGICGRRSVGKRLAVDHDHKTGLVRGLLCSRCNRILGMIGDSCGWLAAADSYLKKHGKCI